MKFLVSRTSDFGGHNPPCSGAVFYRDGFPKLWAIELADLDTLVQFARDNGRIIIDDGATVTRLAHAAGVTVTFVHCDLTTLTTERRVVEWKGGEDDSRIL